MARVKTIKTLKKELWKYFSLYIRYRDKGRCFTCGLTKHPKEMQAGHFISKSIGGLALYFDEINVACQCYRCNINLGGNGAIYARKIEEVYGRKELDRLYFIQKDSIKWTAEDYEKKIKYYKNQLEEK